MEKSYVSMCLLSLLCLSYVSCCLGFGTYGFDIYHRYSDSLKKVLDVDDLPEKGSFRYYSDLVSRDPLLHGSRLATENDQTPVTFESGNSTYRLNSLGFDLFWLPCDCTSSAGVQTGSFLEGAAVNALFGLGMDKISVPSMLAKQGITSNSFSMCFGPDGIGRISFGDEGSSDQGETPFSLRLSHPTYNITITHLSIGRNAANLEFSAIFDSGTSFTYLTDPAYTQITENFNSLAQEQRLPTNPNIPLNIVIC